MAENEEVETEDEVAAEPEEHPEPKPVGHGVVQDNVSEPGVQHTHEVDEDGEVVATSSHGGPEEDVPDAPEVDVESEDALVGAAGSGSADDGSGDDGEELTGEEE